MPSPALTLPAAAEPKVLLPLDTNNHYRTYEPWLSDLTEQRPPAKLKVSQAERRQGNSLTGTTEGMISYFFLKTWSYVVSPPFEIIKCKSHFFSKHQARNANENVMHWWSQKEQDDEKKMGEKKQLKTIFDTFDSMGFYLDTRCVTYYENICIVDPSQQCCSCIIIIFFWRKKISTT